MFIHNILVKLANHLDTLGLIEESNTLDSILTELCKPEIKKEACVIALGDFENKKCLFKNRDRNYKPKIRIYHKLINGVEVLYMRDEVTGWCEGLNEYGIGIVNSALAVAADEKQGKASKKHYTGKNDKATLNTLRDGKRVLKALSQNNIEDSLKEIQSYMGGLRGHTILSDSNESYSLEATWKGHDFHISKLKQNIKYTFTNHGIFYRDAGYTPDKKEDYESSVKRRKLAKKIISKVDKISDIAPKIYESSLQDIENPNNIVRKTNKMRTSSQMILNLTDVEMLFYILPEETIYLGYKSTLPPGYDQKIKLKVIKYKQLD